MQLYPHREQVEIIMPREFTKRRIRVGYYPRNGATLASFPPRADVVMPQATPIQPSSRATYQYCSVDHKELQTDV